MSFELGTLLYLFGFLCGFAYTYWYYRPTRKKEADAAKNAVDKLLKEKDLKVK